MFIVYTAITHGYDQLKEVPMTLRGKARFIAFLERPVPSRSWEVRELHRQHADPTRDAKVPKILPHRFFPEADISLWVDGSVELIMPFEVTCLIDYLQHHDMALFPHARRNCLYQEALACIHGHLDEPQRVFEQAARYTREGLPANLGLVEACVILRRHSAAVERFNQEWWKEIENGSRRDQVSFNYTAWKLGLHYAQFPGIPRNNNLFHKHVHERPRPQSLEGTHL